MLIILTLFDIKNYSMYAVIANVLIYSLVFYMYNKEGKLRLLYECNPIAFLAEQAGGKAIDGYQRILELQPTEIHQRVPFYCGSEAMVNTLESFILAE